MKNRYKLTIEYDGTAYAGWQRQENVPSVQQAIEEAIYGFCQAEVSIQCAGRTDAGVHARGQVAHADLPVERKAFNIQQGLNHHLAKHPIAIIGVEKVDTKFHARFDAKQRHYRYIIINRQGDLALDVNRAWHIHHTLDIKAMRTAAQHLIGKHDFTSFRATHCQSDSPVKTLDTLTITPSGKQLIIDTSALSFLHHQVRNIVGTLAYVGMEKLSADDIPNILAAKKRCAAGKTAPACGLYFMQVEY